MPTDSITTKSSDEKRAQQASYMRAWGRANGAVPVKGVLIQCARCGEQTEKQHWSHDWCRSCVKPAQLERRCAQRAKAGSEPVGTLKVCAYCEAGFTKVNKRQRYCPACSELASREALPAYRARQAKYQNAYQKAKRKTDPAFALKGRMSAGVANSLRDGKNGRSWEALVGYAATDLMAHLERQFLPGMTWSNRNRWHIDHIVPVSSFEFTTPDCPGFKAAWALTNLRPLWATDNVRKSAKRTHLI